MCARGAFNQLAAQGNYQLILSKRVFMLTRVIARCAMTNNEIKKPPSLRSPLLRKEGNKVEVGIKK
jgi:hypothetical protein